MLLLTVLSRNRMGVSRLGAGHDVPCKNSKDHRNGYLKPSTKYTV